MNQCCTLHTLQSQWSSSVLTVELALTAPQPAAAGVSWERTAPCSLCVKRNMPTHHDAFNRVQLALLTLFCAETNTRTIPFHAIPSVNAVREHTGTEEAVKDRKHQRGLECFCCGIQY